MKVLHTADVHLSRDHPERMKALKEILGLAEEEDVDLVLIAGDLFDDNVDVEDLKSEVRPLFDDNDFETLVIPGNHDRDAFREEDFFGNDLEVLDEKPYGRKTYDQLNIVGVPYTEKNFSDLVEPLSEATVEEKENVLLIHCTLAGAGGNYGNEKRYMPVKPEELVKTGYDQVMAGHIHSSATKKTYGGLTFSYPGSPVSISKTETGKRKVWIFDTEEGLQTRDLDTFHYLEEKVELMPDNEQEIAREVRDGLPDEGLERARLKLEIRGFTDRDPQDLRDEVREELQERVETDVDISDLETVSELVGSKLYLEFKEELEGREIENPELVEQKFLRGLSRHER